MAKKRKESTRRGGSRSGKERGPSLTYRQAKEEQQRRNLEGPPKPGQLTRIAATGVAHSLKRAAKGVWAKVKPFIIRNRIIIRAWLIFVGVILGLTALLPFGHEFIQEFLPTIVAKSTGFTLRLLRTETWVSGTVVHSDIFSVEVIPACTGLLATVLFIAAVLAYPCNLKAKLIGIVLGMPAIFLVNLLRMVSLFYVGVYFPRIFETVHLLVWQSLMIIAVVLLWLLWVRKFTHVAQQ